MPTRRALIELFRTDFEWRRMFSKSCRESAACLRGIASQVRDELAEQDKKLPEKLRAASPGILAWAVEGCLEWQLDGLQAPDEVRQATGEYRSEMDVIGAFLSECCVLGAEQTVSAADLYRAYSEWCKETGETADKQCKFGGRLTERGRFERYRGGKSGGHRWRGLDLLTHWETRICRDSDPTDVKVAINDSENSPRDTNNTLGSVGSVGSVAGQITEDEIRQVQNLMAEGMSTKLARAEVLGEEKVR
jgi:phage/plasmid-associated DNA primase